MVIYLQKKVKNVMYYSLLFLCIVVVYFVSNTFVFMRYDDKDYIDGEKKVLQIVGAAGYQGQGIHLHLSCE